ncbi:MAG: CsgG/HfaB family protein [bacterium]
MRRGWIAFALVYLLVSSAFAQTVDAREDHTRMQIALIELEVSGGLDSSLARPLSDRLRQELFKTGVFKVVERNVMEDVLEEQSLHLAGCTSNECAIEVGRILGVQQIVAGSVSRVGIFLSINARLINVETTEVTAAESIDCDCAIEDVLTHRLRELAVKLAVAVSQPENNQQVKNVDVIPQDTSGSAPPSERKGTKDRDDWYQAEFPPAVHRAGSKAAVWMERSGIAAVGFHFGWTITPVEGAQWVGSLGNGLVIQFPATRQLGWFHPEIQLAGGTMQKEHEGHTNTVTISGVYFRAYRFCPKQRNESGFYWGAGMGLLRRSEQEEQSSTATIQGYSYSSVRGEIGLEVFVGSQFDLDWDVGGRKLFTFLELRTEVTPIGDSPLVRVSVQSGLGWKLDTFTR